MYMYVCIFSNIICFYFFRSHLHSTPDSSMATESSTLRCELVSSIQSDHSSYHSDTDHRLPDIEISGEHTLTTTLVSDLTEGIRLAPGSNHVDGNIASGERQSSRLDRQRVVVSPDRSSSPLSSVGGSEEATSLAVSVKEKLLSGPSQKPVSTRSTPTGSRSPAKQPSPPRSVTPDSKRHHKPPDVVSPSHTKLKQTSTNPFDPVISSEKQATTNPLDSSERLPPVSQASIKSQAPKAQKVADGEPKHVGEGEGKDNLAIASAVALSKASAKLSEPGKHKETPLTKQEKDMVALAKAVALSEASSHLNKSASDSAPPDKPSSTATETVSQAPDRRGSDKTKAGSSKPYNFVRKPRLDSIHLSSFFRGLVAHDQAEVMMNVTWGGCSLPSSPTCEIEVGLITSDRGVYLLEVLDPEKHVRRQLSWASENLPLAKIMSIPVTTLSRVTIGIHDQMIRAEFISKGIVKRFAMVPYSHEDVKNFVENLKAVLEASNVKYAVSSPQELILSPPDFDDGVIFLNPDASDLTKLKEAIVQPKTIVQVGNYIASSSNDMVSVSIDEEARRVTDDVCSKFEIEQYLAVAQISSDYLPVANNRLHLRSRVLVLTNDMVYLCKEDFGMYPSETTHSFSPPFPRCLVLDSHPLVCVTDVLICQRPQSIVAYTDPVFEFSITFEVVNNVPSSAKTTFEWQLCAQSKVRIEQFVSSLSNQLDFARVNGLRITRTVDSISSLLTPADTSRQKRKGSTTVASIKPAGGSGNKLIPIQPSFFQSEMLISFARLTNFRRLKFFKKYIAQAEFMKSDEVPLSIFLSHCSTSDKDDAREIEACVLTSNYAIYLLSDLENIQAWIDGGGPISFQARALTSKKDATHLRCFYRLWLTDIKEIRVGLFYLSVIITNSSKNNPSTFVIHTNIPSATLSLLSALSVSVDLRDSAEEEELSDLLSDYIDLAAESVSKQSRPLVRPRVEFIQQHDLDVDKLKQMLLGIGPKISRSRSIEESATTMQIFCQQIMLLVEDIRIRDSVYLKSNPHLVLLTNYGIFVCKNSNFDQLSPSVASPSDLQVRKWCHVDLVESVKVTSRETSVYGELILAIQVRSQNNLMERNTLCLLVQNCELLHHFLHFLCHVWQVRSSRQLPMEWD